MTHRQRILAALDRRATDRLPRDLGATIATTLTAEAHRRLCDHVGILPEREPPLFAKRSGTVVPDKALAARLEVDARPLLLGAAGQRPDRAVSGDAFLDEWGVIWRRPEGGHYIAVNGPFYGIDGPGVQHLEAFDWPDPLDVGRYRGLCERAKQLHEATDWAVVLNLPVGPVHQCQFLRGYGEWLTDLIENAAFARGLLERCTDFWVQVADRALAEAGQFIDVVMYGDDIGTQKGPLVRPELYRSAIKPQHLRMAEAVRRHGKPILYHSCGSVYALIGDLIDAGIAALNPVQVSAAHMDTAALKRAFGRDLAFWGGVDTQRVLPRGTPAEVREETRRRIAELGEGGGYVLCAVHNIQADVPPENVLAMYDAAG